jgi:hypothetical protein
MPDELRLECRRWLGVIADELLTCQHAMDKILANMPDEVVAVFRKCGYYEDIKVLADDLLEKRREALAQDRRMRGNDDVG